jgi:hypothetical protein
LAVSCGLNKAIQFSIVVTTYIARQPASLHALQSGHTLYDIDSRMNFEVVGVIVSDWPPNARRREVRVSL